MGSSRHTSENLPCFTPMLVAKSIGLADENPTMKMRTKTCFIFLNVCKCILRTEHWLAFIPSSSLRVPSFFVYVVS